MKSKTAHFKDKLTAKLKIQTKTFNFKKIYLDLAFLTGLT